MEWISVQKQMPALDDCTGGLVLGTSGADVVLGTPEQIRRWSWPKSENAITHWMAIPAMPK